jgi:hypothetical protein
MGNGESPVTEPSNRGSAGTFDSWKEIATFLRRGVRTVQRWERTEGLPVHRHQHMKRGSVYALESELATWLRARQLKFGLRGVAAKKSQIRVAPVVEQLSRLQNLILRQSVLTRELRQLLAQRGRVEYFYEDGAGEHTLPPPAPENAWPAPPKENNALRRTSLRVPQQR